jgi:hypothetical protein
MARRKLRRRTPEDRYNDNIRKQQYTLEDFAKHKTEWAEHLLLWYKLRNEDIPDDEYRACAFFINKEYRNKRGSLTLLYQMQKRCMNDRPKVTKENAFDILRYEYRMFAKVLQTGGFD